MTETQKLVNETLILLMKHYKDEINVFIYDYLYDLYIHDYKKLKSLDKKGIFKEEDKNV